MTAAAAARRLANLAGGGSGGAHARHSFHGSGSGMAAVDFRHSVGPYYIL